MDLPPLPASLHPVLVHFVVALVPTAAAFAFLHAWRGEDWARKAAYAVLTAAALFALVAMLSGFRDYFAAVPKIEGTPTYEVLESHELLGIITSATVIITTIIAWWKRRAVATRVNWRWALALALVAASLLVAVTGWYGGSLVFDHGLQVTDITPTA